MIKIHLNYTLAIPCQFDGRIPLSLFVAQSRPGNDHSEKQILSLTGYNHAGYQNPLISGHDRR